MSGSSALAVYLDGVRIGSLTQGSGGAVKFAYEDSYRLSPGATPLSLSIPLTATIHSPKVTGAFLWGLLPDSEPTLERWGREFGVSPRNPFALLRHIGRDAAGAVQILPDGEDSSDAATRQGDIAWLSQGDFAELTNELHDHPADWNPGRYGGRWSLAGAQPKIPLFRDPKTRRWGIPRDSTPTTHIVKPVLRQLPTHHINEFLCLRAASAAGLPAANTEIVASNDHYALVSKRYDRAMRGDRWHRLHQEDMCQALSVHPQLKYQHDGGPGVGKLADRIARLRSEDRKVSTTRFFDALAFNVLVGGTDAHAKNYSFLLSGQRAQVAPLYDVASMAPYPTNKRLESAMKIGEHWVMLDVTAKDWASVGRRLGISGDQASARVDHLRGQLPEAFALAVARVPAELGVKADEMAGRILDHVERRWRPSLSRDAATVLEVGQP